MKRERSKYESEAAMCAAFIKWAARTGWRGYAETEGWDVLLVRESDGVQLGVQAKQTLNLHVLRQAIEARWAEIGPDYRAILAPRSAQLEDFRVITRALGVTIITANAPGPIDERGFVATMHVGEHPTGWSPAFSPPLPEEPRDVRWFYDSSSEWTQLCPEKLHPLPDYIPDVEAGASAPRALTQWKVRAIKAAIVLERRGYLTRGDFKRLELSPSRWFALWLAPCPKGQPGFVSNGHLPDFRAQHPRNFAEIDADYATWGPALDAAPGVQTDLLTGAPS